MASKLPIRKLESSRSGKFGRNAYCTSHAVVGFLLLVTCSAAVFILCFTYVDVRTFYATGSGEEALILQRGLSTSSMNSHGSEEGTAPRPLKEISHGGRSGGASRVVDLEADDVFGKEKESVEAFESTEDGNDSAVVVEEAHDPGPNDDAVRSDSHVNSKGKVSEPEVLKMAVDEDTKKRDHRKSLSACDISQGEWVYDETYPLYRSKDCAFADPGFRCEENGRPDTDFMKYRWQPRDCDLPRFLSTLTPGSPSQLLSYERVQNNRTNEYERVQ